MTPACLLDTNILLYLANVDAPRHNAVQTAVATLLATDVRPVIAAQSIFEFWTVATRPLNVNGMGWSVLRTRMEVAIIQSRFRVLPEPTEVLAIWLDLVVRHELKGKRIHDAHLLATMLANKIPQLMTYNPADFPAVDGIELLAIQ